MPHAVVGIVLVAHGLITTMIGFGSMSNPSSAAMPAPSWLAWWPGTLGRSWAFDALNLGSGPAMIGGLVWLAAGLALAGAGLGWLGVSIVSDQWQLLPRVGAVLGRARALVPPALHHRNRHGCRDPGLRLGSSRRGALKSGGGSSDA